MSHSFIFAFVIQTVNHSIHSPIHTFTVSHSIHPFIRQTVSNSIHSFFL